MMKPNQPEIFPAAAFFYIKDLKKRSEAGETIVFPVTGDIKVGNEIRFLTQVNTPVLQGGTVTILDRTFLINENYSVGPFDLEMGDSFVVENPLVPSQGFFRNRGPECFFITPAHVVEDSVDVELTTALREKFEAQVLISYPSDVAILKVIGTQNRDCPLSSWDDGKKLKSLLTVYKEGVIKTKLNDGSTFGPLMQRGRWAKGQVISFSL